MASEIDLIELDDFLNLVDGIIEDIEKGKVKANPLAPQSNVTEEAKEMVVASNVIEEGEDKVKEKQKEVVVKAAAEVVEADLFPQDLEDHLYHVKVSNADKGVSLRFITFKKAADYFRIHPTTSRTRCVNSFVDPEGWLWELL